MMSGTRIPALSGVQMSRKVKEISPNVKVILITGFEIRDNEFSKVFPSVYFDDFMQKLIGVKDLTDKILSLIADSKERRTEEDGEKR